MPRHLDAGTLTDTHPNRPGSVSTQGQGTRSFWPSPLRVSLYPALFSAALLGLLSNGYFIYGNSLDLRKESGLLLALVGGVADLPISFAGFLCLFLVLARWRWLHCTVLFSAFAVFPLATYFAWHFRVDVELAVAALLQTDAHEAAGFIDKSLLRWVILTTLMAVPFALWTGRASAARRWTLKWWQLGVATALVLAPSLVLHAAAGDVWRPMRTYLPQSLAYHVIERGMQSMSQGLWGSDKIDVSGPPLSIEPQNNDLVVVLILGEAARGRSFSLNGYPRHTNRFTDQLPNLVNFGNAWSCSNFTYLSLPCMLTRGTAANHLYVAEHETSVISVFRALGFTTAWLSTQEEWRHGAWGAEATRALTFEAEIRRFGWAETQDPWKMLTLEEVAPDHLFPPFQAILARQRRAFVILQWYGSHAPYRRDYIGPEYRDYQPACDRSMSDCSEYEILNAYDNTIVHTDAYIRKILDMVQDRNALVVYVSDHGESVFDDIHGRFVGRPNGFLSHGHDMARFAQLIARDERPEQRWIPMMWWASNRFLSDSANAQRFARLAAKHADKVSHDNLFHSLIDCAGIKSWALDPNLSLCKDGPVPEYDQFVKKGRSP